MRSIKPLASMRSSIPVSVVFASEVSLPACEIVIAPCSHSTYKMRPCAPLKISTPLSFNTSSHTRPLRWRTRDIRNPPCVFIPTTA
jgi:hypothetical protein